MYLDVLFQVLLPEVRLIDGLDVHQRRFTWGGVEYPQDSVVYRWGRHVELLPRPPQPFVLTLLSDSNISPGWVALDIEGDGLYMLESEINGFEVDWGGRRLDDLLILLLSQVEEWAVVFEPHSDQIDSVYRITVAEFIDKLKTNLRRDAEREGFVAYSAA